MSAVLTRVRLSDPLIATLSCLVTFTLWEVAGRVWAFAFLPPFSQVVGQIWELTLDGTIPEQLLVSLSAGVVGIVSASVVGVVLGALLHLVPFLRQVLGMYIDAMLSTPIVIFVPLLILLFGLGWETRVIVIFLFTFFTVVINTEAGFKSIDDNVLMMARSFGTSWLRTLASVRIPAAWPQIRDGLRLGAARGTEGIISSEVLIATVGLGGLIGRFSNAFRYDRVYATVFVILILALVAVKVMDLLGHVLFAGRTPVARARSWLARRRVTSARLHPTPSPDRDSMSGSLTNGKVRQ